MLSCADTDRQSAEQVTCRDDIYVLLEAQYGCSAVYHILSMANAFHQIFFVSYQGCDQLGLIDLSSGFGLKMPMRTPEHMIDDLIMVVDDSDS